MKLSLIDLVVCFHSGYFHIYHTAILENATPALLCHCVINVSVAECQSYPGDNMSNKSSSGVTDLQIMSAPDGHVQGHDSLNRAEEM